MLALNSGNYDKIQEVQRDAFSGQYTIGFASIFKFVVNFFWGGFDTFYNGNYSKKKLWNMIPNKFSVNSNLYFGLFLTEIYHI